VPVKYAWIRSHIGQYSVSIMCRLMQVSRSGYYGWQEDSISPKALEDQRLTELIKIAFYEGRSVYGSRRIRKKLSNSGLIISRCRVIKLMKSANLVCKSKRKFKLTTNSKHSRPIAPNLLLQNFNVPKINSCFVGDITYIPTKEGWLYLATVIDLCSRKVVGWSMSDRMKASLVNDALLMAIWKRKPSRGLIWHTDRGSQYSSISHLNILEQHGIIQSMSGKGNCFDNAVAESFFATLKTELVYQTKFIDRSQAKAAIFEYIEVFYNRIRMHSNINYLSPYDFENLQISA
jgi:putative transposase